MGVNGWLSPDGVLIECEFRGHSDKALEILESLNKPICNSQSEQLNLNQYISLSYGGGSIGAIGFSWIVRLTEAQKEWFEKNKHLLCAEQLEDLEMKLEDEEECRLMREERSRGES